MRATALPLRALPRSLSRRHRPPPPQQTHFGLPTYQSSEEKQRHFSRILQSHQSHHHRHRERDSPPSRFQEVFKKEVRKHWVRSITILDPDTEFYQEKSDFHQHRRDQSESEHHHKQVTGQKRERGSKKERFQSDLVAVIQRNDKLRPPAFNEMDTETQTVLIETLYEKLLSPFHDCDMERCDLEKFVDATVGLRHVLETCAKCGRDDLVVWCARRYQAAFLERDDVRNVSASMLGDLVRYLSRDAASLDEALILMYDWSQMGIKVSNKTVTPICEAYANVKMDVRPDSGRAKAILEVIRFCASLHHRKPSRHLLNVLLKQAMNESKEMKRETEELQIAKALMYRLYPHPSPSSLCLLIQSCSSEDALENLWREKLVVSRHLQHVDVQEQLLLTALDVSIWPIWKNRIEQACGRLEGHALQRLIVTKLHNSPSLKTFHECLGMMETCRQIGSNIHARTYQNVMDRLISLPMPTDPKALSDFRHRLSKSIRFLTRQYNFDFSVKLKTSPALTQRWLQLYAKAGHEHLLTRFLHPSSRFSLTQETLLTFLQMYRRYNLSTASLLRQIDRLHNLSRKNPALSSSLPLAITFLFETNTTSFEYEHVPKQTSLFHASIPATSILDFVSFGILNLTRSVGEKSGGASGLSLPSRDALKRRMMIFSENERKKSELCGSVKNTWTTREVARWVDALDEMAKQVQSDSDVDAAIQKLTKMK